MHTRSIIVALTLALACTADADAQSDPSPWRFGVSLGGGALLGVVAEYWSDDFGVEARLGTVRFDGVSVRLSPKWLVGEWDGGEASFRAGLHWTIPRMFGRAIWVVHGAELAKVADGGHVIAVGYTLPLFAIGAPQGPVGDPFPWMNVPSAVIGASAMLTFGDFTYRYQPPDG